MSDLPSDDAFGGSSDETSEVLTPVLTTFFVVLICFLCCCRTEESIDDPAHDRIGGIVGNPLAESTPPQTLEEQREEIDSKLIKREVVAAEQSVRNPAGSNDGSPTNKLMRDLSSSPRTYSSFVAAILTRNASKRKIVKFSAPVLRRAQSAPAVTTNRPSVKTSAANSEPRISAPMSERLTGSTISDGVATHPEEGATTAINDSEQSSPQVEEVVEEPKETSEEPPEADQQDQKDSDDKDEEDDVHKRSLLRRRKSNIVARKLASVLRSGETNYDEPTTCDICLMEYEVGDQVAWSPNDACPHAFHTECITDWLLRNPTCPLCRNEYCHVSHPEGEGGHQHNHAHGDDQV